MSKYERLSSPIRALVQHPDVTVMGDALHEGTAGLHQIAPNISQSLQVAGARAMNYLHQKMPKPVNELPGDFEFEPSLTHQRKWMDLHDLVNDPVSVLDHVKHGTLTNDHMNALQEVHPELLQEMQQKVMEHMDGDAVRKLPSSTKLSLGTFLGGPMTNSASLPTVLANQMTFQARPQSMQSAAKSSKGGMKDMNLAERTSTQTEEIESPE